MFKTENSNGYSFEKFIFPNPVETISNVLVDFAGNYTLKIINETGNILWERKGTTLKKGTFVQIDFSKYASGAYWVTLSDDHNKIKTAQIIKH